MPNQIRVAGVCCALTPEMRTAPPDCPVPPCSCPARVTTGATFSVIFRSSLRDLGGRHSSSGREQNGGTAPPSVGAATTSGGSEMTMTRRGALSRRHRGPGAPAVPRAQGRGGIRIGVLNDQNSLFKDLSGTDSLHAVRMAVEDFGGTVLGRPVEVLGADHQNKVDVGVGIARRWYDEGVQLVLDVPNSAICLGVQQLAREKNRVAIFTSGGTSDLTGRACSPNGLHWTYDTYALAAGVASGVLREAARAGSSSPPTTRSATPCSATRRASCRPAADAWRGGAAPAQHLGPVRLPAPGAGLAGAGDRPRQRVRRRGDRHQAGARVRHRAGGQRLAALLLFITDVHSLGLEQAQGIYLVEA